MALHLPAHSLSDEQRSNVTGVHLNSSSSLFATSTTEGWVVYRTNPLEVVTRRDLPNSSLRIVLPLERTNLLFLVGGPPSPLYPPNKVLVWDDKLGTAVAALEFREDVRGLAARRDRLVVALRRRVILFVLGKGETGIWREGGYETCDNPKGLVALATEPSSTLLAFPGRQPGQVQLVQLPPLDVHVPPFPPPPSHDPTTAPYPSVSIILAHTTALSALSTTPSGSLIATASSKGTLVRVWDPATSCLVKELRRGTDSAEIFGVSFRRDGGAVAVSSDKGTVHVWDLKVPKEEKRRSGGGGDSATPTPRHKQLSLLKPYLPKYFSSEWSHSQFRLPPPAPLASRLPSFHHSAPSTNMTPSAAPTIEDDMCICAWVDVEVSDDEAEEGTRSRTPTPGPSAARRFSSSSSNNPPPSVPLDPFSPGAHPGSRTKPRTSSTSSASTGLPSSASGKENLRRQSFRSTRAPSSFDPPQPPRPPRTEAQLIALTQSGGWYRIALDRDEADSDGRSSKEKGKGKEQLGGGGATGMTSRKREEVVGLGRDSTSDCRLVEYRRFGNKDGW
ncbi:hypothetical protein JCM21900_002762 [Sporobolomyces salmonicolor]